MSCGRALALGLSARLSKATPVHDVLLVTWHLAEISAFKILPGERTMIKLRKFPYVSILYLLRFAFTEGRAAVSEAQTRRFPPCLRRS